MAHLRPGQSGGAPAAPAGAVQPAVTGTAAVGGRPQLRPRLPPPLRPGAGRRHHARPAADGPAHRHAGLRPGPAAVGVHPGGRPRRRPQRAGHEDPPRHHRRGGRRPAHARAVRPGAGRRTPAHARRAPGARDEPGGALHRRLPAPGPAPARHRQAVRRQRGHQRDRAAGGPARRLHVHLRAGRVGGPHHAPGQPAALSHHVGPVAVQPPGRAHTAAGPGQEGRQADRRHPERHLRDRPRPGPAPLPRDPGRGGRSAAHGHAHQRAHGVGTRDRGQRLRAGPLRDPPRPPTTRWR